MAGGAPGAGDSGENPACEDVACSRARSRGDSGGGEESGWNRLEKSTRMHAPGDLGAAALVRSAHSRRAARQARRRSCEPRARPAAGRNPTTPPDGCQISGARDTEFACPSLGAARSRPGSREGRGVAIRRCAKPGNSPEKVPIQSRFSVFCRLWRYSSARRRAFLPPRAPPSPGNTCCCQLQLKTPHSSG
jgi:hypothetical protein